ncbi:hypothetical protein SRHO_G00291180 [Serrasalmus rhombeus]
MMTQNKDYVDLEELETRSQVSSCSRTSTLSVASSLALKARAKAEAIRAELAFAKQEAEMLKQQAIIQANLHELRMEKAAAAAQAEGEILEAAAEEYEQTSPPQQRNSIMLPQTPAELHGENAAVQMPVQQPGHQFYQSVTANTLHSFTAPLPDAKPPMTSHSPVCQPTMDNGVQSYRNQGDMPSSEVSDHEFIELAPHHSSRGQTTWTSQQHTSTRQNKPYSSREPPLNIQYKPPQPYQTHSFPMYTNPFSPAATSDLGKYLMRPYDRLLVNPLQLQIQLPSQISSLLEILPFTCSDERKNVQICCCNGLHGEERQLTRKLLGYTPDASVGSAENSEDGYIPDTSETSSEESERIPSPKKRRIETDSRTQSHDKVTSHNKSKETVPSYRDQSESEDQDGNAELQREPHQSSSVSKEKAPADRDQSESEGQYRNAEQQQKPQSPSVSKGSLKSKRRQ